MLKLGIDLGITSTKIVAIREKEVVFTDVLRESFSTEGLAHVLEKNGCSPKEISSVYLTGVGSDSIHANLFGHTPVVVPEFEANVCGARFLCSLDRFLVVSMGTGTSFIKVEGDDYRHVGGSALGGGTLEGFSNMLFQGASISKIAEQGALEHIDVYLDETTTVDPSVDLRITASSFKKARPETAPEDVAIGLVNLVIQNIGVMAHLASAGYGIRDVVCIGGLTNIPQCEPLLEQVSKLFKCHFIIPKFASFATAIGAVQAN